MQFQIDSDFDHKTKITNFVKEVAGVRPSKTLAPEHEIGKRNPLKSDSEIIEEMGFENLVNVQEEKKFFKPTTEDLKLLEGTMEWE